MTTVLYIFLSCRIKGGLVFRNYDLPRHGE